MKRKYMIEHKPEIKEAIQLLISKNVYSDLFDLLFAILEVVDDMRVSPDLVDEGDNDFSFGLKMGMHDGISQTHDLLVEVLEEIHDAERKAMEDR